MMNQSMMGRTSVRASLMQGGMIHPSQQGPILIDSSTVKESEALTNIGLGFLIIGTFGLIALFWVICEAIESMKSNSIGRNPVASFQDAGGLIFGLFCFYVISFGVAWYIGSGKREQMMLDVIENQLAREKALQALQNME